MTHKTSVVIPFYQEEAGILREAVVSACSQTGMSDLEIIVIDDGSPSPARADLEALDLPAHVTLKVIEQPNRGPGAARNRGLDSVSPDTEFVAFLDSDDRWTASHLANAVSALDHGYDLYFADRWHSARNQSFFDANSRPEVAMHGDPEQRLHRFIGRATLETNLCPTSCVVYRYRDFADLRFVEDVYVGEDRVFWRELTGRTDRVIFSDEMEAISGTGIHICQTSGWGTPRVFWKLYHYMKWHKWLRDNGDLDKLDQEKNAERIRNVRRHFALNLLHDLKEGRSLANRDVLRFVLCDPIVLLYLAPTTLQELRRKLIVQR